MINNRQAGRRNRGRNNNNNGRSGGQNRGGNDNGNRIDSRARGNAAQLLEKYRNMARDAQLSGDRVNAEYYLQFADHYFRVLADNRARQEEAQGIQRERQPQRPWDPESDGDDFDGADGNADYDDRAAYAQQGNGQRESRDNNRDNGRDNREQGQRDGNRDNRDNNRDNNRDRDQNRRDRQPQGQYQPQAQAQPYAQPRREETVDEAPVQQAAAVQQAPLQAETAEPPRRGRGRPPRQPRVETIEPAARSDDSAETGDVAVSSDAERPRRGLRQRRPRDEAVEHDEPVGLDLAVLPPAIARADNDSAGGEEAAAEAPRKRPRARRPAATEAAE